MAIESLRKDGERLHEALGREQYRRRAGIEVSSDFSAVWRRFEHLADPDTFRRARDLPAPKIAEWIAGHVEEAAARELCDRRTRLEAEASAVVRGEKIRHHELPGRIRNCADRQLRFELAGALDASWRSIAPLAADGLALGWRAVESLGMGDYTTAIGSLAGFDVRALAREAEGFLSRTEDLYREALADAVRRATGLALRDARLSDLWFTFRLAAHDATFRAEEMAWRVSGFLRRMGVDPAMSGRIRQDLEERPAKHPRACCIPIRIPDEVVLVLRPTGGMADYRTFLHEMGHALHRASTDRTLPFEDRVLGDSSVTEAYASSLDRLASDRVWLRKVMKLPRSATEIPARDLAASNLLTVRREAAKLCREIALHDGAPDPEDLYREWLSRASGVPVSADRQAIDLDPGLHAARTLRAWLLEAVLAEALRERFDEDWFENPRAGAFLAALWAEGQRRDAEQIARESLGEPSSFEKVARRFEEILR